ncbi:MAG: HesA/MoeB/ThiF family protein [Bacteroides sp.]|nr:HesA/MoeB/ThiF family protein [Bacteroides sp.]
MKERYNRNILIEDFGEEGQTKLKNSKVLVIGAGGLGSPVILYLAAAGVGTLGIVDRDKVNISNLQRQILHTVKDLQQYKVNSAKEKVLWFNPEVNVITYTKLFTRLNANALVRSYDFIVDCSDNYETKFLINDACVKARKPFSHAAVVSMQGEVMTVIPGSACYRCAFPEAPIDGNHPTASEIGILGSIAGIVGSIQATEVVKYLTGIGELLTNKLLIINGRNMTFQTLRVKKINNCCNT